jgi:hypothetical protein
VAWRTEIDVRDAVAARQRNDAMGREPTSAWHLISSARCRRTVFVKKFVSVGGLTKVSVAQQHD